MATKLDRSRPYGQTYGTGPAYRFQQDGKFFKGDGSECTEDGERIDDPDDPIEEEVKDEPREETPKVQWEVPPKEMEWKELSATIPITPSDGLEKLKMKQLRARYYELTKKRVPVATTKEQLIQKIRKAATR